MGSALSLFESTEKCDITKICSSQAKGLAAGAAGAGIGTFWSYFITVISTIVLSFFAIGFQRAASKPTESYNNVHASKSERRAIKQQNIRDKNVIEHVILSFSDQQLVTGLAMAITTRYFTNCALPLSAYHYDIVCYLLLCSVVTHLCTIVAVNHYFYFWSGSSTRATISRLIFLLIRCIGMAVTIVLTGLILFNRNPSTFPVKPPSTPSADPSHLLLRPAACFFIGAESIAAVVKDIPKTLGGWNHKNWDHGLIQFAIFVLAVVIAIPVALLHSLERGFCSRAPPVKLFTILRILVVVCGSAVVGWNLYLAYTLRSFMHSSGWLNDVAAMEQQWTFGQMLSVLILVFAPFTAFNAAADKYDRRHHLDNRASAAQVYEAGKLGTGYANNGV